MAITDQEATFIEKMTGSADFWPDQEKFVYNIRTSRREASEYLYNDSNGDSRIDGYTGLFECWGAHADSAEPRVYLFLGCDSGENITINDPKSLIDSGLGDL